MQINWFCLSGGEWSPTQKYHQVKNAQLLLQQGTCSPAHSVSSTLIDETQSQQQKETQDQKTRTSVQGVYAIKDIQQPYHPQRRHLIWVLLLLAATLLWVLSSLNIVQQVWATVLNAAFTSLSTIFALLQWRAQEIPESPRTTLSSVPERAFSYEQLTQSITNKRKGTVVVYTSRKWRGSTLHLLPGLQKTTESIEAAANVVERRIAGQRQFLCHFPAVPPGHYTLSGLSKLRRVQVTVRAGHLAEIDWR